MQLVQVLSLQNPGKSVKLRLFFGFLDESDGRPCLFQNGLNALHLAAKEGHEDLVEELLERGAPVDSATKVRLISCALLNTYTMVWVDTLGITQPCVAHVVWSKLNHLSYPTCSQSNIKEHSYQAYLLRC